LKYSKTPTKVEVFAFLGRQEHADQYMNSEELEKEHRDYYLGFLTGQTQVIAQRNQFLLVFQSMMLTALGVFSARSTFVPVWLIILLGLVVSIVWLYINAVSFTNEEHIEEELMKCDERFVRIASARKRFPLLANGNSSKIVTFFFPSTMTIVWSIILVYYVLHLS
jgi:hypothetical protein